MSLLELCCDVDDFWQTMEQQRQQGLLRRAEQKGRESGLCVSEITPILIYFHQSAYRYFKTYYQEYVLKQLQAEFPGAMS